ncbi:nuclear transport factor 2 family protein [Plantactinospora sp. CA-290183]|uniref:nuclear transport factor 2 family protein n=1 Tax=Plantactinospora sp. CA-290183 TaxID=3240006 RepID=UPI003D8ACDF0
MSVPISDVISRYLQADIERDVEAMVGCFTEDAVVVDKGRTWHGRAGVRDWRASATAAYEYTVEVRGTEAAGPDNYLVEAHLEGDFPGSPADLRFAFRLRGDLIDRLEIAP